MERCRVLGTFATFGLATLVVASACSGRFDFDVPTDAALAGSAGSSAEAAAPTSGELCLETDEETSESEGGEDQEGPP